MTFASATASGIVDSSAGNTVDIAVGTLPAGGSVLITYQANVLTTPTGVTTLNNTVNDTTTSLPGANGTLPFFGTTAAVLGASGAATGERTGADGIGGALNDYATRSTERLGSLGDRVYVDYNADGVQDAGEPGIVGASIAVRWAGLNSILGDGDDSIINTTTGVNGGYSFTLLPTGTFRVREVVQPAPYTDGIDTAGNASGDTATNDQISAIPVGAGADLFGYNFGELPPADPFSFVYLDQNQNGVKDAGESGIAASRSRSWAPRSPARSSRAR